MRNLQQIGSFHDPKFSVQADIKEQVDKESWVDWALKPTPELVPSLEARRMPKGYIHLVKRSVSILMP